MVPFPHLLAALAEVPDPRRRQGKRYPLPHLLMFTVLALLSGARSYRGIITFLEQRRDHLNRHFGVDLKRAPGEEQTGPGAKPLAGVRGAGAPAFIHTPSAPTP